MLPRRSRRLLLIAYRRSAAGVSFILSSLRKKLGTAFKLLRNGGVENLYDHWLLKRRLQSKGHSQELWLSGCKFNLDRISDYPTRVELIMNKYEAAERRAVARYVRRKLPVVELGGSMGVVACVTNKLLHNPAAHVVVEANPLVIPQLERNKALNHCQFEIVNRAIAYGTDSVTFRPSSNVCISSITEAGDQPPVTVGATQLASLVLDRGLGRFNLVCDIEGVEYDLVQQDTEALKQADTIILETHARFIGDDKCRLMLAKLKALGFRIVEEIGYVVVLRQ